MNILKGDHIHNDLTFPPILSVIMFITLSKVLLPFKSVEKISSVTIQNESIK